MNNLNIDVDEKLAQFKLTERKLEDWEDLINRAAKLTGFSYIATHKRIERIFEGVGIEVTLSTLRRFVHASEKENSGRLFNWFLKDFKNHKKHGQDL